MPDGAATPDLAASPLGAAGAGAGAGAGGGSALGAAAVRGAGGGGGGGGTGAEDAAAAPAGRGGGASGGGTSGVAIGGGGGDARDDGGDAIIPSAPKSAARPTRRRRHGHGAPHRLREHTREGVDHVFAAAAAAARAERCRGRPARRRRRPARYPAIAAAAERAAMTAAVAAAHLLQMELDAVAVRAQHVPEIGVAGDRRERGRAGRVGAAQPDLRLRSVAAVGHRRRRQAKLAAAQAHDLVKGRLARHEEHAAVLAVAAADAAHVRRRAGRLRLVDAVGALLAAVRATPPPPPPPPERAAPPASSSSSSSPSSSSSSSSSHAIARSAVPPLPPPTACFVRWRIALDSVGMRFIIRGGRAAAAAAAASAARRSFSRSACLARRRSLSQREAAWSSSLGGSGLGGGDHASWIDRQREANSSTRLSGSAMAFAIGAGEQAVGQARRLSQMWLVGFALA